MADRIIYTFKPTDALRVCRALREAALTRKWQNDPLGDIAYSAVAEWCERRLMDCHEREAESRLAKAVMG